MEKRIAFYSAALLGLTVMISMIVRPSLAQEDGPTDFQTATAQAEAYSTFVLTVESAFRQTQTA